MVGRAGGREPHAGTADFDAGREQGGHQYYYQRQPAPRRFRHRPHEHRQAGDTPEKSQRPIEQRDTGMRHTAADEPVEEKLAVRLKRILAIPEIGRAYV